MLADCLSWASCFDNKGQHEPQICSPFPYKIPSAKRAPVKQEAGCYPPRCQHLLGEADSSCWSSRFTDWGVSSGCVCRGASVCVLGCGRRYCLRFGLSSILLTGGLPLISSPLSTLSGAAETWNPHQLLSALPSRARP